MFGTYEKVSDSPLTVKQTLADTATWSDGVPVTPADLVLSYGAQSGLFNNYEAKIDDESGNVTKPNEGNNVFFNSSSASLALIKEFPVVEGKSITYKVAFGRTPGEDFVLTARPLGGWGAAYFQ